MSALATALCHAVRAQNFAHSPDGLLDGAPLREFPSLDLAFCLFRPGQAPLAANVLFSREHPSGFAAAFSTTFGAVQGVDFRADVQDESGTSVAWLPGADWSRIDFPPLFGSGRRFVAPYPASLLKLMLAVGLVVWVEQGKANLDAAWSFGHQTRSLRTWQHDMLAQSCNQATTALVAWAHAVGLLGPAPQALHGLFEQLDLPTLRFDGTRTDGGWRNADGAGVGRLQMTAWDSLRLLWWLDDAAPPCPWTALPRPVGPGVQALRAALRDQQRPGFIRHPGFAHKTGNTDNYSADAGWLNLPGGRHLLVALTSNLGARYAAGAEGGFPAALLGLGRAIEDLACTL